MSFSEDATTASESIEGHAAACMVAVAVSWRQQAQAHGYLQALRQRGLLVVSLHGAGLFLQA